MRNVESLGEETLGLPVRLGVATDVVAAEPVQDPRFTTAIGLLRFATDSAAEVVPTRDAVGVGRPRFFDKVARLFSFL